jgi:hypothetical protein
MSTQPTEAHLKLANRIRYSDDFDLTASFAQLIADSEARAVEHAEKEAQSQRDRVKAALIAIEGLDAALTLERERVRVLREALTDSREYVQSWGEIAPKACEPLSLKVVAKIDAALAATAQEGQK